jgi:hypothetical protein
MRRSLLLAILAFLAIGGSAPATAADSKQKALEFLAHSYQCSGTFFASPAWPERSTQATMTGEWTLGGRWVTFSYIEEKTAKNTTPRTMRGYFGMDPMIKVLVMAGADDTGSYSMASSPGWTGDTIVFVGDWHGTRRFQFRDTITKDGSKLVHALEQRSTDDTWVKYGQQTCTRTKE